MTIGLLVAALSIASGSLVGLTLGLIGGGGSVLAVPLLVYLVGMPSAHLAIGTSAIAVALNAAFGLAAHARLGTVKWPCAMVFSAAGIAGALLGSVLGKALDGTAAARAVRLAHDRRRPRHGAARRTGGASKDVRLTPSTAGASAAPPAWGRRRRRVACRASSASAAASSSCRAWCSATGMALPSAIGTSLFAVTAFGLTTAASYAVSGFVDWRIALLVIAGGAAGIVVGTKVNARLARA